MGTVAYYRSSTDLQEESVDTQREFIRAYSIREGYLIDDEYEEPGKSARKLKLNERKEVQRLLGDIRKGKVSHIIVYKRDRLARKVQEHMELYYFFRKYKVTVSFAADNEQDIRYDVMGEMFEMMIAAMNQREGEQINERISDTKIANFMSGKTIGPFGTYGYYLNKEKTKIIRNEEELTIAKLIFDEWRTGNYQKPLKLSRWLNDQGYSHRNDKWTTTFVTDILTDPLYHGLRVRNFKNKVFQLQFNALAVISLKEFEQAQALLGNSLKPKAHEKKEPALLTGLVSCQICLASTNSDEEGGWQTLLTEFERQEKGEKLLTYECVKHGVKIRRKDFEEEVLMACVEYFTTLLDNKYKELYENYTNKNIRVLKKLLERKERELAQSEELFILASTSWIQKNSDYRLKLLSMEKERFDELKREVEDIQEQIISYKTRTMDVSEVKEQLKQVPLLDFHEKQKLVNDVVLRIQVNKNRFCINFKHPFLENEGVIN